MEKIYPADDSHLQQVLGFAEEELEGMDCPMKYTTQILICLEELFVNVAHYAYVPGKGNVAVCIEKDEKGMMLRLTDSGTPFDPLAKPDPDTSLSVAERGIGGLGIYMVKKTMDEVHYERRNDQNIFTCKKYF